MTNRGKTSTNRQTNKSQNDDDNCSVICYKHPDNKHVGVVRIRQQPICSACNLLRATLSSYYKHIVDNNHRENVKKLCDENRFVPTVYDQAIHLAFHNNFHYQSEKFHFLYKHTNDEILESEKMEVNNNQQRTMIRKRRNFQVTLVFQGKTYSQIGIANAYIREELLKEMVADRADDLAALPMEIYYTKKKNTSEDIHHNAPKSTDVNITNKDQSQVMLKKQQQEPFSNGELSSAENSRKGNGVEQNTAMTTHEISTADINDHKEQSSIVDDIVCKSVLNHLIRDVYTKSEEFKREQLFLNGLARRNFRRRCTFYCDLCDILLPSEKECSLHLYTSEHIEKTSRYETICLPWRRTMQKSLITGKPLKTLMDQKTYDNYISTMVLYLAPNSLYNRGRFCCAYCEVILTNQWTLEKHIHSVEHKNKKTSADHKELVISFANSINFSVIFKFNGISQLSEVPDDIKTRYRWQVITHAQLDKDIQSFIQGYPFDSLEGVTRMLSSRAARKQKLLREKAMNENSKNNDNNQRERLDSLNKKREEHRQKQVPHRATVVKRPTSATIPPGKRFREDLNNTFPGTNQNPKPTKNYEIEKYKSDRSMPHNNGNNQWPNQYPNNHHQQQQSFEQSNFRSQPVASDNSGHYGNRSSYPMTGGYNYNQNQQGPFNGNNGRGYDDQQSNYDPNFSHPGTQGRADHYSKPNPSSFVGQPNSSHQRTDTGPINNHIPNRLPHPQQQHWQQQQQPHQPQQQQYQLHQPHQQQHQPHQPQQQQYQPHQPRPQQQQPQQQQYQPRPQQQQPHQPQQHQQQPHQPQQPQQQLRRQYPKQRGQQRPTLPSLMSLMHSQDQHVFGAFANNNNNLNNSNVYSPPVNQQPNNSDTNYRSPSTLPNNNTHSSMYPSHTNTSNPVDSQVHTLEQFGIPSSAYNSSNSHAQSRGPPVRNRESLYDNYGYQNQMKQNSWHGSSTGGNDFHSRGGGSFRGGSNFHNRGRGGVTNSFQPNKQSAPSFSYRSQSNNNNNNYTNFSK